MRGDDIADRLVDFAVRIFKLCARLDKPDTVKYIRHQLFRSATSVGANYEEARGAESKADFIHKMGVAYKEMRETIYWLKFIRRSELIPETKLNDLNNEAEEINAILIKSLKTARSRK
ncbi:MAG: four helix bundle protein [candidate division Zixibacteria bacterium]|nr:four helix bundle protein [Candidatus Tariuqbacter arcticus]